MDLNTIEQLGRQAEHEKWTYPQLFDALKEAGVTSYDTDVPAYHITYHTAENDLTAPAPSDWISLTVAPEFDEAGIKNAIAQTARREISYPEFLAEIATSGVRQYHVDMNARTVTYEGANGQALVEPVPPSSVTVAAP